MTIGKALSYYYYKKDDESLISFNAGRINSDGEWEFHRLEVVIDDIKGENIDAMDKVMATNLAFFLENHAIPFWKNKVSSNSHTYGHPV